VDEIELVKAARGGDAAAFTTLVRRHERSLHATACAILGAGWDASDAVQDTLLTAWTKLRSLREPAAFGAWLTRILVNRCTASFRRGSRRREVVYAEVPEPAGSDAYEIVGPEATLDLIAALRSLEREQREVLALRYFRDLKIDEIAEVLGCPAGTVKSRINRALGRLGTLLSDEERTEVLQ
jgi:RNA polymerase sigma factor (sigma-70 family)